MIPYGHQSIDDDDVAAVVRVMRSDWLTQGPAGEAFEDAIRAATGAAHAVVFSSGTAALHSAVLASGLGPGDRVVTSPLSFVASANCAVYAGATPAFVDVDPGTLNMDLSRLGPCDGLVAVHYAGLPLDLGALRARPRVVIEDAAHALGASTPDGPVGNCARSDMCAFSFHPVKAVTSGEGGAVTTNDQSLAVRLREIRNHGIVRRPELSAWYYEVRSTGLNYRMTDIQAALGTSQMSKLVRFTEARQALATRYHEDLAGLPIVLPPAPPSGYRHAYHLFPVRLEERDRVFVELRRRGIGVQVHYIPIHWHPLFREWGYAPGDFPEVERAYAGLLSLPLFPSLSEDQRHRVVRALREVL
ncbi:MAG: UDP-4-amino-4,6-dideoxy-N-acetyl-beta-L-altrosamine transaminase [Acidimicrobiales bacterium]